MSRLMTLSVKEKLGKIASSYYFYLGWLCFFYAPSFIKDCIPYFNIVSNIIRTVIILILLGCYITGLLDISRLTIGVAAFLGLIFIEGVLKDNYSLHLIKMTVTTLVTIGIVEIGIQQFGRKFLSTVSVYFSILLIISIILGILFPEGLYKANLSYDTSGVSPNNLWRHFLGHKNGIIVNLMPGITSLLILFSIRPSKSMKVWLICVFMETVFLAYIVDAINSLICLLIGCLLAILFYKSRKIKFKRLTLIAFVGFFDILCTVVPLASIMGGEMFFGRDLTFTGRTYIWNLATNLIAQSPIIGHGFMTSDVIAGYLGGYSTPHNEFLLVLMYGGCIALVLFIVGVSFLMRPLDSEANLLSAVLKAVIVSLGIYCIFETVSFNTLLIFPFIYSYHFGQIKNLSTECVDINEEH